MVIPRHTFRQVLVNRQENGLETRTSMQLMRYHGVLPGLRTSKKYTPRKCSRSSSNQSSGSRSASSDSGCGRSEPSFLPCGGHR